jgi:hypothetical protein
MTLDLLAISKLRGDAQHQALRTLASQMVSEEVPEHAIEEVEDVMFLLDQLVRQQLYRGAAPSAR